MEMWEIVCVDTKAVMRIREENKTYNGVRWLMKAVEVEEKDRYIGWSWKDQFVSNERLAKLQVAPKPGDQIILYFDRMGSICKVDLIDAA